MNNSPGATIHKRINITLPADTIRLLDRVAKKGDRSGLLDRAVRFYVRERGRSNLRKQLRLGAGARAARDLAVSEEWFPVETEHSKYIPPTVSVVIPILTTTFTGLKKIPKKNHTVSMTEPPFLVVLV